MCINISSRASLQTWAHIYNSQKEARYLSSTVSFLSALGSLAIIVTYCLTPALKKATSRQLLVYLAVADFFASVSAGIGSSVYLESLAWCEAQAFVTVLSTLSSVLWSTCMAVYMYLCIGCDGMQKAKRLQIPFHIISWGIPMVVAVAALLAGALGSSGDKATIGWCWIDEQPTKPSDWFCDRASMFWMLFSLKGWEVLSYVVIPAMYVSAKLKIKKSLSPQMLSGVSNKLYLAMVAIDHKLSILPLAYVILRIWGTLRAFLDFSDKEDDLPKDLYTAIFYLQAIGDNAQGIVNFFLFVWLTDVVQGKLPGWTNFSERWQKWRDARKLRNYEGSRGGRDGQGESTSNSTALLTSLNFARGRDLDGLKESLLSGRAAEERTNGHWWSVVDYDNQSITSPN